MSVKGIKRGQMIELLEVMAEVPDGAEVVMDVELVSTNQARASDVTKPANADRFSNNLV